MRYAGTDDRFRYTRGAVVEAKTHDFHLAGVLCSEFRVDVKLDGGNHTIRTPNMAEWRIMDAVEVIAELRRS